MNKVILTGRLTKDPEVRYTAGENCMCIARYTLAVNRKFHREDEPSADFINCIALGKLGEHAERYFRQGMKVNICGRIQTGSYTNRDGQKIYTTDVVIEEQEFGESKNASSNGGETMQSSEVAKKSSKALEIAGPNSRTTKSSQTQTNQTQTNSTGRKNGKGNSYNQNTYNGYHPNVDSYMNIPDDLNDLPFK